MSVKELWKSVSILWNYDKNSMVYFFDKQCTYMCIAVFILFCLTLSEWRQWCESWHRAGYGSRSISQLGCGRQNAPGSGWCSGSQLGRRVTAGIQSIVSCRMCVRSIVLRRIHSTVFQNTSRRYCWTALGPDWKLVGPCLVKMQCPPCLSESCNSLLMLYQGIHRQCAQDGIIQ